MQVIHFYSVSLSAPSLLAGPRWPASLGSPAQICVPSLFSQLPNVPSPERSYLRVQNKKGERPMNYCPNFRFYKWNGNSDWFSGSLYKIKVNQKWHLQRSKVKYFQPLFRLKSHYKSLHKSYSFESPAPPCAERAPPHAAAALPRSVSPGSWESQSRSGSSTGRAAWPWAQLKALPFPHDLLLVLLWWELRKMFQIHHQPWIHSILNDFDFLSTLCCGYQVTRPGPVWCVWICYHLQWLFEWLWCWVCPALADLVLPWLAFSGHPPRAKMRERLTLLRP